MADDVKMVNVIPLVQVRYTPPGGSRGTYLPGTKEKPAEAFPMEEGEALRLARMKPPAVEIVPSATSADQPQHPAATVPPTRAELEQGAKALGIDLGSIVGTGRNGALKNADIAAAIAARRHELEADVDDDPGGRIPGLVTE
ncbi:MAG TPA: hypothetical protein VF746_13395 [Longimicrobium sp.]|jgi:hypothetical protein